MHRAQLSPSELHLSFCQHKKAAIVVGANWPSDGWAEKSERRCGGLLVICRPDVKGPISHRCLMGPVVLSGQYFKWKTTNGFPPGWVDRSETLWLVAFSFFGQDPHLCWGSDRSEPGNGDTEGFPRCLPYSGIIYGAKVMTDGAHRDTQKM